MPRHVVESRRERLSSLLSRHRYLPLRELCSRLGVSEATVRRDLAALERDRKVTRTYGGALSEFNDRFPSFHERLMEGAEGKRRVALATCGILQPGGVFFFDSGTTVYAVAEELAKNPVVPLTVVTSNLPVAEVLSAIEGFSLFLLAGQLFHRQSVLLGEPALRSLEFWRFDAVFLSAEGITGEGLFNSRAKIVEQQIVAMKRAKSVVFCVDSTKVGRDTPYFLTSWPSVDLLVTDAKPSVLRSAGIHLPADKLITAGRGAVSLRRMPTREGAPSTDIPVHFL